MSNQNNGDKTGGRLLREELQARLPLIAEKDPSLLALFAGRCALRAMPFLVNSDTFGYLKDADVSKHQLAIWFAATLYTADQDSQRHLASIASRVATTATRGTDTAQANAVANAAAFSANAAFLDSHQAAWAAVQAADQARMLFFNSPISDLFLVSVKEDLGRLERTNPDRILAESLRNVPIMDSISLWNEPITESNYLQQLRDWQNAVMSLAEAESSEDAVAAELLRQIPSAYEAILVGKYSQESANQFTQQLADYFESHQEQEEKPKTKDTKAHTKAGNKASRPQNANSTLSSDSEVYEPESPIYDYNPSLKQCAEQPSDEDHLGRSNVCEALAAILSSPDNKSHQTIGLLGEWGSGKSSWIRLLQKALDTHSQTQPFLVSTFNAWSYEHTPNLQAGIAHEVIKTFVKPPQRTPSEWAKKSPPAKWFWGLLNGLRDLFWTLTLKVSVAFKIHGSWKITSLGIRFLAAIIPFPTLAWLFNNYLPDEHAGLLQGHSGIVTVSVGLVTTFFLIKKWCADQWNAIWATPQAKELLTYLKLPDYAKHLGEIPEMRKTLEKFCDVRLNQMTENKVEGGHTRLLVVIDDLDRCSHQGIVKVFEAVRLVLELDHVSVVIAVDQHIALAALALHYKDLAVHHKLASPRAIARDYLAKVIHLPITLSKPEPSEVEKLLQKIWESTEPPESANSSVGGASLQQEVLPKISPSSELTLPTQSKATSGNAPAAADVPATQSNKGVAQTKKEDKPANQPEPAQFSAQPQKEEPAKEIRKVIGLSKDQKTAFIYWSQYFSLNNPRQLKRLNTTYNLLLGAYKSYDKTSLVVASDFGDKHKEKSFPVLIAIMTIEYLNSLDNADLRKSLRAQLFAGNDTAPSAVADANSGHPINAEFIAFFKALSGLANMDIFKRIEPYVLPAIECAEEIKFFKPTPPLVDSPPITGKGKSVEKELQPA